MAFSLFSDSVASIPSIYTLILAFVKLLVTSLIYWGNIKLEIDQKSLSDTKYGNKNMALTETGTRTENTVNFVLMLLLSLIMLQLVIHLLLLF